MSTDNAPAIDVLRAVRECALAWEPDARILGNVRACDIARAIAEIDREPEHDLFDDGRDNMADDILDLIKAYEDQGHETNSFIQAITKACQDQLTAPVAAPSISDRQQQEKT